MTPRLSPKILQWSQHLYRWLLHLYPNKFREGYGEEMLIVFNDCCQTAYRQAGLKGISRVWLFTLTDFARNVPAEHLEGGIISMFKRGLDIVIAGLAITLLLPFLPVITILIKLDSRGSVFHVASRVGRYGQLFNSYKLRTMTTNTPYPLVTRIGHILRVLRIDELPQFYNILKGEMSLWGPPAMLPDRIDLHDPIWQKALQVTPGLMGRFPSA